MKIYGACAAAALAGLLMGYDLGVVSGVLLYIEPLFHLTSSDSGFIVSAMPLGALFGALTCGKLNDKIGRKYAIKIAAILFLLGSLACATTLSIEQLIAGRLLLGMAIGIGSFSAPLYIAEIAQKEYRGKLVTFNQLAITLGIVLAYIMDYYYSFASDWRAMMGFGAVLALLLLIMCTLMPRSPRWLALRGKPEQALEILKQLHGEAYAREEMHDIQNAASNHHMSLREALRHKGVRSVLLIGIMVSILTQGIGTNAIIYYAPHILKFAGFSNDATSLLGTVGIGCFDVIFTVLALFLLDRTSRRRLLLMGLFGIAICLLIISISIDHQQNSQRVAWTILISMMIFIAFQALSTGPACWLIPSEIFPTQVRGLGMGLSVAFNWWANVVVAFLFPIMVQHLSGAVTFEGFLGVAIFSIVYFYYVLPETRGVSLEAIENLVINKGGLQSLRGFVAGSVM